MKRKTSGKATKRAGHKKIAAGYKVSRLFDLSIEDIFQDAPTIPTL
jgi:hypothetical protein